MVESPLQHKRQISFNERKPPRRFSLDALSASGLNSSFVQQVNWLHCLSKIKTGVEACQNGLHDWTELVTASLSFYYRMPSPLARHKHILTSLLTSRFHLEESLVGQGFVAMFTMSRQNPVPVSSISSSSSPRLRFFLCTLCHQFLTELSDLHRHFRH